MSKVLPFIVAAVVIGGALTPVLMAKQADPADRVASQSLQAANMNNLQKISYAMGYQVSGQMPPEVDVNAFSAGIRDAKAKKQPQLTDEQIGEAFMAYQQEQQAKLQPTAEDQAMPNTENNSADKAFLVENAKKPGVVTTASGLQYEVLEQGTGAKPKASDEVKVHYEGKLINGTVFDSSLARGEPLAFGLSQVIPGWTEGLQLMQEGGKYRFFIPSDLAYGSQNMGSIPPNSTLIFEVTLIKVNP